MSIVNVVMYSVFFFFKQKTAYEIMPSLVGSEMCIRDRYQRRVHGGICGGILDLFVEAAGVLSAFLFSEATATRFLFGCEAALFCIFLSCSNISLLGLAA
eukprot:TRINITY_DN21460_c0_g1_i1.p4 TRINITY_DN21460_c0_g1~~TRINITY_DN21460_c0_g1_i1.p4  ORF type:complete len:100 (+),score=20.94 TRINITY_DN21460_c0_g1_i1:1-300(+)